MSVSIFLALLVLILLGPFLIPVPPLEGTAPERSLATPESEFAGVDGVTLHYLEQGSGPLAFLLLHGYPSNAAGWNSVLPELALYGRTVAYDQAGFGLSERLLPGSWPRGANPYLPGAQVEQAIALLDSLGIEQAVWLGSSSGGVTALRAALEYPERVSALVLEGAPVYSTRAPPPWSRPLLYTPQMNRLGPLLMRQLGGEAGVRLFTSQWAQSEGLDEQDINDFGRSFEVDDWDRGLWEVTKASRPFNANESLAELPMPVLVLAGASDPIVPSEESERLAREIPGATLALMDGCGHVPHRECPAAFMQVLTGWLEENSYATE
ncbi:MAG: alpha/beta hydrolase [Trueperaceae bacterium]